MKKVLIIIFGLLLGISIGYALVLFPVTLKDIKSPLPESPTMVKHTGKQVVGFLPYWLLSKTSTDYSSVITQLSYFSLSIDTDGHIKKLNSPIEEEPGWFTLHSGKMDTIFAASRKKNIELSLTVFSGDNETIDEMMTDPINHAKNLMSDVLPLMKEYHFTNLNLDVEKVNEASSSSQVAFQAFTKQIATMLKENHAGTLTVDIAGSDLIKEHLIDSGKIAPLADYLLIMGYDFHFAGSYVTGPVAPLYGAGVTSEYDTDAAVEKALSSVSPEKIILGIPDYGYEWETIGDTPRSAVIPGTGVTASTERVENLLTSCTRCEVKNDQEARESYLTYKDEATNSYHQIFYPTEDATKEKIDYATQKNLAGLAVWALGYEGVKTISPLREYLR